MQKRPLLTALVCLLVSVLTLSGCASKYGEQITEVNHYPQCYKPIADLREDENAVAKSTAAGAVGGALLGATIGYLVTGKASGAAAGAVAGGVAGGVAGNVYGKNQQQKRDAQFLARYAQALDADTSSMTRATAAAQVASKCYNEEFRKVADDYRNRRITRKEFDERYKEIRAGLQEISYVLTMRYDDMTQKDQEYQAALLEDYTKAPAKAPKKSRKAKASGTQTIREKSTAFKEARDDMYAEKLKTENYAANMEAEYNTLILTGAAV